jgi:hypothetical protein
MEIMIDPTRDLSLIREQRTGYGHDEGNGSSNAADGQVNPKE